MYKKNNRVGSVKPKESINVTVTKEVTTITVPFQAGERNAFDLFIKKNCMTKGQFVRQCILAGMAGTVR